MRKATHAGQVNEGNIDMTPMLDIVFIMLIFFIVTTSFVKENGLSVHRPAQDQVTIPDPSPGLSIKINQDGSIIMNNRQVEMSRLVANIQAFLAEFETNSIAIMAHPKAKHRQVVKAVNLAKSAGIENVSMLVEK